MNVSQPILNYTNSLQQSMTKNAVQKYGKHHQNKQPDDPIFKETLKNIEYSVEISSDGKQKTKDIYDDLQKKATGLQGLLEQLKDLSAQGQAEAESIKVRIKCLQIALRIMSGDKVPVEDHQYLLKHDPELYAEAVVRRIPKENPHEHDRLSEDEKSDNFNNTSGLDLDPLVRFGSDETAVQQS